MRCSTQVDCLRWQRFIRRRQEATMVEPGGDGISGRLWRLAGQLLLALIKAGDHPALQPEMAQLKEALTVLNASVDRLGNAKSILTDEAIGQLGRSVSDALTKLRDCTSSPRQMALRRAVGPQSPLTGGKAAQID